MHIFTDRKHIIIDTRSSEEFLDHHIEGSVFVGFNGGNFKYWLELLLPDKNADIEVIATALDADKIMVIVNDLGYRNAKLVELETTGVALDHISTDEFKKIKQHTDLAVLDVREADEYQQGSVGQSEKLPLSDIIQGQLPNEDKEYIIHCGSGYRSTIAMSLLKLLGRCKFINLDGGYQKLTAKK
ncbi:rhodanese-like domain-containing protein [Photobacterium carnosum]|jgi:rhodanese-related sulfurtransferase|uniref:rhodanese-like domain-containing protein n=1 Tax=Photobacterium carnosum TaxID=2023717 RepID=UPI001E427740|nr:rhodanese-like domain-containing protein [Photobacterium carnosum]MCD9516130.1 rhodanese domain-containing protein [Photobacterium carnosum]MCD9522003.1 rhodanese domain-containing protein [Photobacterium carnosum]MCD9531195.1 rhodanese domain-containing protein [Photobacterium carnosum]MCD9536175.1 rhodanese domain-containing protein [Photobacterium carnosum]MCD9539844.1 rhodanese domain-containing protein [Photobacterium carnosum]